VSPVTSRILRHYLLNFVPCQPKSRHTKRRENPTAQVQDHRLPYSAHRDFLASAVWVGNLLQKLSIFFFDKKHAKRMQLTKPFFPFPNWAIYSHAVHFREGFFWITLPGPAIQRATQHVSLEFAQKIDSLLINHPQIYLTIQYAKQNPVLIGFKRTRHLALEAVKQPLTNVQRPPSTHYQCAETKAAAIGAWEQRYQESSCQSQAYESHTFIDSITFG
jgi:hypothetical protein